MTTSAHPDPDPPHASYVEAWKRRLAEEEEADRRFAAEALDVARRAVRILVERYGVRRAVLFGSLAGWRRFRRDSDVDLAVEGLDPRRFIRADADLAWNLPVPIDLKLLGECPPPLRQRIEEEGVVLHEG